MSKMSVEYRECMDVSGSSAGRLGGSVSGGSVSGSKSTGCSAMTGMKDAWGVNSADWSSIVVSSGVNDGESDFPATRDS